MATSIHPTAIVEPGAQLGADCEIQAGAVITRHCILGDRVVVHPYAVVGGDPQYLKFDRATPAGVRVGAGTVIREHVTINRSIHAGEATVVGENCFLMAASHVAHDCVVGNQVVLANNAMLAGHVSVGDHTFVGGGAGIHQFCRIGAHAMLSAMAKLVQDLPPYFIADGTPAEVRALNKVGLERRGFTPEQMDRVKLIFRILYRDGLNRTQALEKLAAHPQADSAEIKRVLTFAQTSERGLAPGAS